MTYSEKLQDPRWQKLRLEILNRDGFKCRCCGSLEKTLNVHHSYYKKGFNPWDYPSQSLVTVCKDCHQLVELRKQSILESTANPNYQKSICVIADAIGGIKSVYPKSSSELIDEVAHFLRYAANCSDVEPETVASALDCSAMRIIKCICEMKHEAWWDTMVQSRASLDSLIDLAPETPNGRECNQ